MLKREKIENEGRWGTRYLVTGDKGAIQFLVWDARKEMGEGGWAQMSPWFKEHMDPMPADLGYHARVPQYDGQIPISDECPYIGGPCYYDGSSLAADYFLQGVKKTGLGDEAIFTGLEMRYRERFGEEEGWVDPSAEKVTPSAENVTE